MKLLTMPSPASHSPSSMPGLLPQVWATEGNLARTVVLIQASAAPATTAAESAVPSKRARVLEADAAFYRSYTEGLLRRYGMMQLARARVPAMLGGSSTLFRGRASTYRIRSFDDVIIFVHDIDGCLRQIPAGQVAVLRRVAVLGYTFEEAAAALRISARTVRRHYTAALDALTPVFLERGLLEESLGDAGCQAPLPPRKPVSSCRSAT